MTISKRLLVLLMVPLAALLLAPCAAARPLELTNPEPRWVAVAKRSGPN